MNAIDVAIHTTDTIIKINIDGAIIIKLAKIHVIQDNESNIKIAYPIDIFIADKLFQIRKEIKPQDNLKSIRRKVLIVIGASSQIKQSIASIAKAEGAIVHRSSREDGVDVSEKSTFDAVFRDVFKKMEEWTL